MIEFEFCDWCDGGAADLVYNMEDYSIGGEIDIETGIMTFWAGNKEGSRKVNYCPMCGRAVKGENNQ